MVEKTKEVADVKIIVVTTHDKWIDMLNTWMEKHVGFEDHSDAIQYIVRDYILENKTPKYVKLIG